MKNNIIFRISRKKMKGIPKKSSLIEFYGTPPFEDHLKVNVI